LASASTLARAFSSWSRVQHGLDVAVALGYGQRLPDQGGCLR
jgi:hypothetical protein